MNLLLDAHVLLWWMSEPEKLSKAQLEAISKRESVVLVSAATVWELRIKENLGKLEIPARFFDLVRSQGFEFLSISAEHADYVQNLPPHHKDPFDRMLIAQALTDGLTIVTQDKHISMYEVSVL